MSRSSESENEIWLTPTGSETPSDNVGDMGHSLHSRSHDGPDTPDGCPDELHSFPPETKRNISAPSFSQPVICYNVFNTRRNRPVTGTGYSGNCNDANDTLPPNNANVAANCADNTNQNVPDAMAEPNNDTAMAQQDEAECNVICLSSDDETEVPPRGRRCPRARVWRSKLTNTKKTNSRVWFTPEQRRTMVYYLIDKSAISLAKGYRIWMEMINDGILAHHTPQSLQEHFRKVILPQIEKFPDLTEEQIAAFVELRPSRKY